MFQEGVYKGGTNYRIDGNIGRTIDARYTLALGCAAIDGCTVYSVH